MSTQTQSLAAVSEPQPADLPYEGFDCGGLVQLCQGLRSADVREYLGVAGLCFDRLAWAPRNGDRLLGETQVERIRERFAFFAARHGQSKWRGSLEEVQRALWIVADENPMHPVAQRLSELRWDGVSRLGRVATDLLGVDAERSPHAAQRVRKWFIGTVARAFRPGTPMDTVLTLVGEAPASMFFRLLVPPTELADAPQALDSEEMSRTLREKWLCVQNELPLLAAEDPAQTAAFLSRTSDEAHSYGAPESDRAPRTTVFVAAVTALPEIADDSLRRRFRVIPVGRLDTSRLETFAEQLWAEATVEYLTGVSWRLTPEEEAAEELLHRRHSSGDPWEAPLLDYMTRKLNHDDDIKAAPSMAKILADVFGIKTARIDIAASMRAGRVLTRHGYRSRQIRLGMGRVNVWYPDWLEDDGTDDVQEGE